MNLSSKTSAQKRVDQVLSFQQELAALEAEQVLRLDEQQKSDISVFHKNLLQTLENQFDIDVSDKNKQLSLGMKVASFLGALAMAVSVFFLFYQYWGYLALWLQVLVLCSAPLFTLVAAFFVREKEKSGYFSKLLALISFCCFVLNLSMFGQIFNLPQSPTAFLVWSVYALLLAYALDLRLLLGVGILSFYGFLAAQVGMWCGIYWLSFGEYPENFILPSLLVFCVPLLFSHRAYEGFEVIYRVFSSVALFLVFLSLAHWGRGSYLNFDPDAIEGVYQLLGFVFSAALVWLGIKKQWSDLVNTGNVFFVIFLYSKFFDWWWDWMPKFVFFFVMGLSAVLILVIFNRLRKSGLLGVAS